MIDLWQSTCSHNRSNLSHKGDETFTLSNFCLSILCFDAFSIPFLLKFSVPVPFFFHFPIKFQTFLSLLCTLLGMKTFHLVRSLLCLVVARIFISQPLSCPLQKYHDRKSITYHEILFVVEHWIGILFSPSLLNSKWLRTIFSCFHASRATKSWFSWKKKQNENFIANI